jgi:hypothetical protein
MDPRQPTQVLSPYTESTINISQKHPGIKNMKGKGIYGTASCLQVSKRHKHKNYIFVDDVHVKK